MRTFERALVILSSLSLGASLAAGCGGGGSGGGGDVTTGIAPSKLLSEVTEEEAAAGCERLQQGFERKVSIDLLVSAVCTLFSAAQSTDPAACAELRDACLEQANDELGSSVEEIEPFECDALGDCEGTVGDLETCFNDTLDAAVAVLRSLSCDDAGNVEMSEAQDFAETAFTPAASCEQLECSGGSPFGD